jgi:prepilin-type N-terminal cleavage/methylation domain-containing protein
MIISSTPLRKITSADAAEKGFTLIEVLVAITLFSIVSMGLAGGFVMQMKANNDNAIRIQAISAAQQVLDSLRVSDPSTYPTTGSDSPRSISIAGRIFSVVVSYCAIPSLCTAVTTRHLRAAVTYKGKKRYEVDTVFSQLK